MSESLKPRKPREMIPPNVRRLLQRLTDKELADLKLNWVRWEQQSRLGEVITPPKPQSQEEPK